MNKRNWIVAVAIAALPLGLAIAQSSGSDRGANPPRPNAAFEKLDKNRDGRISQSEASTDSTITWSSADANRDGFLDAREWATSRGASEPGRLKQGSSSQGRSSDRPSNPAANPDSTGTGSSSGGGHQ